MLVPELLGERIGAAEERLAARERARSAAHAALLRDVHALETELEPLGYGPGVAAHVALVLDCSERRAHQLLQQSALFRRLPGGLAALDDATFTEEQAGVVADLLVPLAAADAALVWPRLLDRLAAGRSAGVNHPPARLAELIRRILAELLPDELARQRRQNSSGNGVGYELNGDGTGNLHAFGMTAPNLHAALSNIAARSAPLGDWDTRSPDQRRLDVVTDLLTGRQSLPCAEHAEPVDDLSTTRCGCPAGSSVPCGADVVVLVPLATALGLADVPAMLGDGQVVDADLLARLLRNAPQLRAVTVDDNGVPVEVSDRVVVPAERFDDQALREALAEVAAGTAGERFPVHPGDHGPPREGVPRGEAPRAEPPDDEPPQPPGPPSGGRPPGPPPPRGGPARRHDDDELVLASAALGSPAPQPRGQHPVGAAGPYSIRPRLRRLLRLRSPRCEWPGCGARAVVVESVPGVRSGCDLDHDDAWPDGPTCACNLGPLCRHHHRVKQLGWRKTRLADGAVRWTGPSGRSWLSPRQAPDVPVEVRRASPAVDDELAALRAEEQRRAEDAEGAWLPEPDAWRLADPEHDPYADEDRTGQALRQGGTAWTLDLRDPYRWLGPGELAALR